MKIVFLDRYSVGDSDLSEIKSLGEYVEYTDTKPAEVVARCEGAQVVITNKVKLMQPEIDALPELRLICVAATGTNNIDMEYAAKRGVEVRNVPAYSTQSVAETTFSLALALLRNVPFYNDYVQDGSYAASDRCFNLDRPISQISDKRWGIIGMGNIGRRVAELATAFGAKVSYYSTSGRNTDAGYPSISLEKLLAESDIVSIHCPLNPQTLHLVGYEQIKLMKRTSILINVGRGGIIIESDLAKALNENLIAGAGIDVFEHEPMEQGNPLLTVADRYKLIMAPHCAWSSAEARKVLIAKIAGNISTFFSK